VCKAGTGRWCSEPRPAGRQCRQAGSAVVRQAMQVRGGRGGEKLQVTQAVQRQQAGGTGIAGGAGKDPATVVAGRTPPWCAGVRSRWHPGTGSGKLAGRNVEVATQVQVHGAEKSRCRTAWAGSVWHGKSRWYGKMAGSAETIPNECNQVVAVTELQQNVWWCRPRRCKSHGRQAGVQNVQNL